ncbi:MAG: DJ-1/PfpI family protein [Colwellia sp.]
MIDMKKLYLQLITSALLMLTAIASPFTQAEVSNKKVLMVLSSYGEKQGEEKPGFEFDEFSKAYLIFKQNNIQVDIASPKGGKPEADKFDATKPYNAKVLADKAIMNKLSNTLTTSTVKASHYAAVFIVGGKGAMFDLPKDKALSTLIASVYQQQGTIAAVCHGPAALVNVKLDDGSYLVANKAVNSFTNQEEQLFGKKWLNQFDFLLEDKLIERGGKFQSSDIMLSHVAVDERLITGQNPTSTHNIAIELVKMLGLTPVSNDLDIEDRTMALVAEFLKGDKNALNSLTTNENQYHVSLVGMYGFYYLKTAKTTDQFESALALMSAAKETINNPALDMKIASTQYKLGKNQAAKATLEQILQANPEHKGALEMKKSFSL